MNFDFLAGGVAASDVQLGSDSVKSRKPALHSPASLFPSSPSPEICAVSCSGLGHNLNVAPVLAEAIRLRPKVAEMGAAVLSGEARESMNRPDEYGSPDSRGGVQSFSEINNRKTTICG